MSCRGIDFWELCTLFRILSLISSVVRAFQISIAFEDLSARRDLEKVSHRRSRSRVDLILEMGHTAEFPVRRLVHLTNMAPDLVGGIEVDR